jgi:serine/threonine-protein kinase BUR1
LLIIRNSADEKGSKGKKRATLYMVSPYADHDLSGMLTNPDIRFNEAQIKCYMQQLLEGLRYLHDVSPFIPHPRGRKLIISSRTFFTVT